MDKSHIINEIKLHLNIKTDSDFAKFLNISQPTVSAWRKRNTIDYELIITKCKEINAEWLITGKGKMLKDEAKSGDIKQNAKGNNNTQVGSGSATISRSQGNDLEPVKNKVQELENLLIEKNKEIERVKTLLTEKEKQLSEKDAFIFELQKQSFEYMKLLSNK